MAELNFDTTDLPGIPLGTRVQLDGVVDVTTADAFRATLLTLLSMGRRRFLLDFGGVEHVHSAGFACMVELSQHLRETGGIAVICAMQKSVQEVVLSLGLDAFFGVADHEEKAMALLKWAAPEAAPPTLDEMDGADSVGFTIGPGESSGDLMNIDGINYEPADALIADAVELDDEYSSEQFRMSAVQADAGGVVSTDGQDTWNDSSASGGPGYGYDASPVEAAHSVAVALGAQFMEPTPVLDDEDAAESFDDEDVLITSNDTLAPPPPPSLSAAAMTETANDVPIGWATEDAVPLSAESSETNAIPVARATSTTLPAPAPAGPTATPAEKALRATTRRTVTASTGTGRTGARSSNASNSGVDLDLELADESDLRVKRLKATARLLQWIPEAERLWRKMLVYLSRDPVSQVATLNLVVARVKRQNGVKDAFPVAAANPYVMVKPRIPGGVCIPEMIAVDVTAGGHEVSFRIERDKHPDRPDAPKGRPCLEIWYGPSVIRTIHTADPFS